MIKRIISILLSFIIFLGMFPLTTYAKETEAFDLYKEAVQATVSSGSWQENLAITADMLISNDSTKTKTKVTANSLMDISNYSENDLSSIELSGSTNMSVMGQVYAWDIQYENGVAHYKYTEPNQKSSDIEMDPNYFNFNKLTQDMLEDAKVFGNKITFTVPGNKMNDAVFAAVNLLAGAENLNYDNMDVEVTIDKTTGTIDTVIMTFHASLTYQGYDAEVDYCIDYKFSKKNISSNVSDSAKNDDDIVETETENGLIVYSDYTNLSIRKDSTITLSAGIIIDGKQIEDVSGITFLTDNSSILSISDTGIQNNRRYVKFKGIDEGTTIVSFSDSNTGYTAQVPVTVYVNNYLSYTLNSVPTKYIEKYPTNIYNANGLYIDSYTYTVNDDKTATVSFDVYNANYTYGAVYVYDAEGKAKDAVLIKKMSSNNIGIKKTLWDNSCCLVRDIIDGDLLSYRQETGFSKCTPIKVVIPENGYIKISNDPANSSIVNIVNSVDILMSLGKLANKVNNYNVNSEAFSKALTSKLLTEKAFATLVEDGSELTKELWKGFTKNAVFSSESLGNFCNTASKNLSDFDLEELIADTAVDFGWDVGEEVFTYFTGPIKMVFDGLFAFGKLENIITQHADLVNSSNVGSIYIQNQGGGTRSSHQINVESDTEFSKDTSLNVFRATLESDLLDILKETKPDVYDAITNGTSYTYNISLLKNGMETQPDGEVTVCIPIPEDMKLLAYTGKAKIYRVEEDNALTEMDVKIEDGCFVFNTSHLSLYTLVGDNALQSIIVIVIGVVITIFIAFLFRKIKKKSRMKNA